MTRIVPTAKVEELPERPTAGFLLKILLSVHFILYAVSPIYFACASDYAAGAIVCTAMKPTFAAVSIGYVSIPAMVNADTVHEDETVKILLKKKRAVMPSLDDNWNAILSRDLCRAHDYSAGMCVFNPQSTKTHRAYQFLYSGLSPPFS